VRDMQRSLETLKTSSVSELADMHATLEGSVARVAEAEQEAGGLRADLEDAVACRSVAEATAEALKVGVEVVGVLTGGMPLCCPYQIPWSL
jgi:hypothetical protein